MRVHFSAIDTAYRTINQVYKRRTRNAWHPAPWAPTVAVTACARVLILIVLKIHLVDRKYSDSPLMRRTESRIDVIPKMPCIPHLFDLCLNFILV